MKKAAFFVEGQTELIFVERLLLEIAGSKNISFAIDHWHSKQFVSLRTYAVTGDEAYFALIVDCHNDGAIVSAIRSRHASLAAQGYSAIIGLRDLYPLSAADLPKLKNGMEKNLPTAIPPCTVTVAVHEVEAWFVQEDRHFPKIDARCTRQDILQKTGYDIELDMAESLVHPSDTLLAAYRLGGKTYNKKARNVQRTVNALDFEHLYLDRRNVLTSFDDFASHIDSFLS